MLSRLRLAALFLAAVLVACGGGSSDTDDSAQADARLRALLQANGVTMPGFQSAPDELINLGQALFESPLLSGSGQVACASCHPTANAGVDNQVLGIGVDGIDAGAARKGTPLPRNTPDLMNLTMPQRDFMFRDGRIARRDGVFVTPAGSALPDGLDNLAAVQALFPLLARNEMLGEHDLSDGNALADLNPPGVSVEADPQPVWNGLMQRLRGDAVMASLLQKAFPSVPTNDLSIQHVGNAIAAFEARRWNGFDFKNELKGYIEGWRQIGDGARRGGILFFDKAGCGRCHGGPLLSDQKFHNLAVPQIGPGFGSGAAELPPRDKGRFEVSGRAEDRYAFVTPSLWEVKNTFPYMHNGVYSTLEETVRHHLNATQSARAFRCPVVPFEAGGQAVSCQDSAGAPGLYADLIAGLSPELATPITLSEAEIADLVAFLGVLTDGNNESRR